MTSPARRAVRAVAVTVLPWAILAGPATTVHAEDPHLDQQIGEGQAVDEEPAELAAGHVDIGPRYVDSTWSVMVHDDTNLAGSVWRRPEHTALVVDDAAKLEVPASSDYAFLGVDPGTALHVIPQTQNPDVVWIGWNTQDPEVMEVIDRGVTLDLVSVQGPGHLVVYLQDGGFGEPDVLWDSRTTGSQPIWVPVNTHTHANWVFTEPGSYLVQAKVSASLVDGTEVSDTRALRFAVGTDPAEVLSADEPGVAADVTPPASETATGESSIPVTAWVLGGAALFLAALLLRSTFRARAARRRADRIVGAP